MTSDEIEICRRALERVVGRYGWRGQWDETEFLREIQAELEERIPQVRGRSFSQIAEDAATFCYCRRWYGDCRKNGAVEQHAAFDALWKYLYRSTLYKVRGDEHTAQEVAQQVLISVWHSLDKVREPGFFLGYVRQAVEWQIPRTLKALWKSREGELVEEISEEQESEEQEEVTEDFAELEELIRRCLPSKERQTVILEYFLSGKIISEIAQSLGKKPGTVSTLKTRAIDQLRGCPEMIEWRATRSNQSPADAKGLSKSVAHLFSVLDGAESGMTCDECRSWLPVYVEAEVSGFDVAQRYPEVRRHLDLCADCEREYVELLDSTLEEMEADWSNVPVPPPDLSFLPPLTFQAYLRWLLERIIQQRRPARLPDLQVQMEPLLRQFSALLASPVPSAVATMGQDLTYERLNLATYDVARSLLQDAPPTLQTEAAALEMWVRRKAAQAAQHQKLSGAEADAFVAAVTELVCRNPSLLQQVAR